MKAALLPLAGLRRSLAALALLAAAHAVCAREATPLAADPALEARVMAIAHELRCLVCQNETIASSQAGLAVDLREQIRERLRQGKQPEQIRAFMVERYGSFVLYKPPFEPNTWVLWVGPFVLLAGGLGVLGLLLQRRSAAAAAPPLSAKQARAVEAALQQLTQGER